MEADFGQHVGLRLVLLLRPHQSGNGTVDLRLDEGVVPGDHVDHLSDLARTLFDVVLRERVCGFIHQFVGQRLQVRVRGIQPGTGLLAVFLRDRAKDMPTAGLL